MPRSLFTAAILIWVQAFLFGPELMKLPFLLGHFQEHCLEIKGLTFGAFLDLHYADVGHEESGDDAHEQLPYHHHHGAALDQQFTKVLPSDPLRPVSFPAFAARQAIALPVDKDLLAGHHPELLRPPRTQA